MSYCSLRLRYNLCKIRWDKFIVKGILFEEQMAFRLYRSLYERDIPETSYCSLSSNALQPVQVSLISVYREGHFAWTKQFFASTTPSIRGTFL